MHVEHDLIRLRTDVDGRTAWHFAEDAKGSPTGRLQPAALPASTSIAAGSSLPPQAGLKFVEDPGTGQCVGTLRWSAGAAFPPLPPWDGPTAPALDSWRAYLETRLPPDESGTIRVEPPMLDGLSYPLTLVHAMRLLRLKPPRPGPFAILVLGASSKAEERLLRDSNYWEELLHYLPGTQLELLFVGPEVEPCYHGTTVRRDSWRGQLVARCFRGTLGDLLRAEPRHTADSALLVGFNTGMGSGLYPLMRSWLPDLLDLLRAGFVAVFTCANDYSDLKGELLVFSELLGAALVLPPRQNPFKAATVVREDQRDRCEWSCSSSFMYAVRGRVEGAQPLPPPGDAALEKALRELAKKHKRTQVPSTVP